MRVLVTGGLGFVGRNVSLKLIRRNHEVTIIDSCVPGLGSRNLIDLPRSVSSVLSDAKILVKDVRDLEGTFFELFDVVIHLAAVVGGRLTIEYQPLAVAEDLEIDSFVIRNWGKGHIKHLVYASSSAAYPVSLQTHSGRRLREEDISFGSELGMPDLTYGWSKLTGEFLLNFRKDANLGKTTIIRPFSGFGVDQDSAYPFPSILRRVAKHSVGSRNFEVWGSGLQERDFIHIDDIIVFMVGIVELSITGTFNLATGIGTSFRELASHLLRAAGEQEPRVVGKAEMPEGVFSRVGDTSNYFAALEEYGLPLPNSIDKVISSNYQSWINYIRMYG